MTNDPHPAKTAQAKFEDRNTRQPWEKTGRQNQTQTPPARSEDRNIGKSREKTGRQNPGQK